MRLHGVSLRNLRESAVEHSEKWGCRLARAAKSTTLSRFTNPSLGPASSPATSVILVLARFLAPIPCQQFFLKLKLSIMSWN